MSRRYPKELTFTESDRGSLTFSDTDKIRLDSATRKLVLKKNVKGKYPTDADIFATYAAINPESLKAWVGFHSDPRVQPTGASVGFKLNDGTDDRYWDGGAWAVAGASDWNTEAEIAANFATFPPASETLSVVINLVTTDKTVTPSIDAICLMLDCEFDYLKSIIGDSLVPSLREFFDDLVIDYAFGSSGSTKLSLYDLETPFNVVSVLEAYDHTADPEHKTDLFSSYDTADRVITLTSAVTYGDPIWFRMKIEPEIMVSWGSQDYLEIDKIPAVVIDRFTLKGNQVAGLATVRNMSVPNARILRNPYRMSIEIDITLIAEKTGTLLVMMDRAAAHAINTSVLRWRAVDEKLSLTMIGEGNFKPTPNLRDEHSSSYSLRIDNVHMWLAADETVNLIESVVMTTELVTD